MRACVLVLLVYSVCSGALLAGAQTAGCDAVAEVMGSANQPMVLATGEFGDIVSAMTWLQGQVSADGVGCILLWPDQMPVKDAAPLGVSFYDMPNATCVVDNETASVQLTPSGLTPASSPVSLGVLSGMGELRVLPKCDAALFPVGWEALQPQGDAGVNCTVAVITGGGRVVLQHITLNNTVCDGTAPPAVVPRRDILHMVQAHVLLDNATLAGTRGPAATLLDARVNATALAWVPAPAAATPAAAAWLASLWGANATLHVEGPVDTPESPLLVVQNLVQPADLGGNATFVPPAVVLPSGALVVRQYMLADDDDPDGPLCPQCPQCRGDNLGSHAEIGLWIGVAVAGAVVLWIVIYALVEMAKHRHRMAHHTEYSDTVPLSESKNT